MRKQYRRVFHISYEVAIEEASEKKADQVFDEILELANLFFPTGLNADMIAKGHERIVEK